MNQSIEENKSLKNKLSYLYNNNKRKFFSTLAVITLIILTAFFININNKKKNNLISEKYVKAQVLMNMGKIEESKNYYEEIIYSKNIFYSILSLNSILEKNLTKDEEKILGYFNFINNLNITQNQKNLVTLKKALYLLKIKKIEEGKKLLNNLIDTNSQYKNIAKELITG
tara:strand:- start:2055 stop:2564 length:510 start_codon:yes stop_codon:yes gene_type:complete